jgi:type I restriction enzyme, S subunit
MSAVLPLKHVAQVDAGQSPPSTELKDLSHGLPFLQGNAEFGSRSPTPQYECSSPPKRASIGDILLSVRAPVGALNIADQPYGIGRGLASIRAREADSKFIWWWLHSQRPTLNAVSTGTTYRAVTAEDVEQLPFPQISLDEQRRIAGFLDAETARIDALTASRCAQISVLEELEIARIGEQLSAAETTGPVYAYFDVQLGKMLNAERAAGERQQAYLRHANVHWYEINTEDMATMTFEPDERRRYGLRAGDLLVNEGGAGGTAEAAVWDGRIATCYYQKSLHRIRARSHVPVEWLMYWLRFAKASGIFDVGNNRATIPHLTREQLAEYRIPIPADGHRRVGELSSEIAIIHETQRKMASANALLAERREALITAAVTGHVNVATAGGGAV